MIHIERFLIGALILIVAGGISTIITVIVFGLIIAVAYLFTMLVPYISPAVVIYGIFFLIGVYICYELGRALKS